MRLQYDKEHRKLEKVVTGIVDNLKLTIEDVQKGMKDMTQVMHIIRGHIAGSDKNCQTFNSRLLSAMQKQGKLMEVLAADRRKIDVINKNKLTNEEKAFPEIAILKGPLLYDEGNL